MVVGSRVGRLGKRLPEETAASTEGRNPVEDTRLNKLYTSCVTPTNPAGPWHPGPNPTWGSPAPF